MTIPIAVAVLATALLVLGWALAAWAVAQWRRAQRDCGAATEALTQQQHVSQAVAQVLQAARVALWEADTRGVFTRVDDTAARLMRVAATDLVGVRRVADTRDADHRDALAQRLADVLRTGRPLVRWPNLVVTAQGEPVWVSTTVVLRRDAQGRPVGLQGCDQDINTRHRLVLSLQAAERRHRLLTEHAQSILYTIDPAGRLTYVSPSWQALLGHPPDEVMGRDFRPFVHPEDVPLCEDFLARTLRERRVLPPLTYRVWHRDGSIRYHRSVLAPVFDDDGRLQAVVGNAIDVTTDIELRAQLERVATHDALTGVANRRLFIEQVQREVERNRRNGAGLGLLMLDLDHFKDVNDTHGHAAGDAVLIAFVQRCRAALRPSDVLGRLGGEEFAAVLPQVSREQLQAVAERVRHEVARQPYALPDGTVRTVTVSIGAAVALPAEDSDALLQRADRALYAAKHGGRDRVVLDPTAPPPAPTTPPALPPFPALTRR